MYKDISTLEKNSKIWMNKVTIAQVKLAILELLKSLFTLSRYFSHGIL